MHLSKLLVLSSLLFILFFVILAEYLFNFIIVPSFKKLLHCVWSVSDLRIIWINSSSSFRLDCNATCLNVVEALVLQILATLFGDASTYVDLTRRFIDYDGILLTCLFGQLAKLCVKLCQVVLHAVGVEPWLDLFFPLTLVQNPHVVLKDAILAVRSNELHHRLVVRDFQINFILGLHFDFSCSQLHLFQLYL